MQDYSIDPKHDPGIYQIHTLANGIPIFYKHVAKQFGTPIIGVTIMVAAGSRDDEPGKEGAAHYLEHVVFQGTKNYPNRDLISKPFDEASSYHNAFTAQEHTEYVMAGPASFFPAGFTILADQVLNPLINTKNVSHERKIITEEEKSKNADVNYYAYRKWAELSLGDHPLSRPSIGSHATINKMSPADLQDFHQKYYIAGRITIGITGDIPEATIIKECEKHFGHLPKTDRFVRPTNYTIIGKSIHRKTFKPTQFNRSVAMISRTLPMLDFRQRVILSLFENMMSMGTTSPLFTQLREKNKLCYSYGFGYDTVSDFASLYFEVEASIKNIPAVEKIFWQLMPATLKDKQRFEDVKSQRLARILLGEFTINGIHKAALGDLEVNNKVIPLKEFVETLISISHAELVTTVAPIITQEQFYTVIVDCD